MRALNGTDNSARKTVTVTRNLPRTDGRHGWGQKIALALQKEGQPLTTDELVDLLEREYPVMNKDLRRRVYLTNQIFHACKREWIRLHYNTRRKGFYCLPEWFNDGGLPDSLYEIMNRLPV